MTTQYWLVKQEPSDFSWDDFVQARGTAWTGVRNYQARNNLQAMRRGDEVLFYHSGDDKQVVGLATVRRAAYADPTADEPGWVAVDLAPVRPLATPVTLARIKAEPALREILLVRNSRLSVSPLQPAAFARILRLAGG